MITLGFLVRCVLRRYVLFMLPKLSSLDTLLLADETKQLAEATFLKKQMYYNMRIKTMHRNARNIIKLATEGKRVRAHRGRLCNPHVNTGNELYMSIHKELYTHLGVWCWVFRIQAWSQHKRPLLAKLVQQQHDLQRELEEATAYASTGELVWLQHGQASGPSHATHPQIQPQQSC